MAAEDKIRELEREVARLREELNKREDHSKCRAIGEWYGVPAHAWGEQP